MVVKNKRTMEIDIFNSSFFTEPIFQSLAIHTSKTDGSHFSSLNLDNKQLKFPYEEHNSPSIIQ